jgi:hypothetical protein
MYALLRQVFVAILGGVVAVGILLVTNPTERQPSMALAQTSINGPNSVNAGAPHYINYQGQVYNPNGGAPYANAGLNFSFRLYNNPAGTIQVYQEDKHIITNADGFFNTNIGDTVSFGDTYSIFNGQELYLGIYINNQALGPLQTVSYVPYAMWARSADKLKIYDSGDFPKLIAFGVVNDNGDRASGEGFSSDREEVGGADVYIIDIDNINHSIFEYTTIVTPACNRPVMTGVGTAGGDERDMIVDMWDANGNRTECRFEFMVLAKEKAK